ncbi:response regulator transcription factor [Sulfurimonas sp. HSL-3221]|uniref:response regulator n=1 Tax=Sulfurimonadaceae TaxID=2771471 RepID=UPI001E424D95|nr:response regulator transcription factor [Sulfurimonas sp. HSL-3221]UFS61742.1 response regulator transcription factor [Sulfurimonas sp. HSL-3221]
MLNIIIADDHEIVRSGLIMLIEQQEEMSVSANASSFDELMALLASGEYALLILDLNLGDKNGMESIESVSVRYPNLPILVLSAYPEDPYALQAFRAGASGYLNKAVIGAELIRAIATVAKGKKYISPTLEETMPYGTDLDKQETAMTAALSKRELEVLSLIARGLSYKEIAAELGVSPKTVSTYRTRILEKLNLSSTTELLRFAFEHDIAVY